MLSSMECAPCPTAPYKRRGWKTGGFVSRGDRQSVLPARQAMNYCIKSWALVTGPVCCRQARVWMQTGLALHILVMKDTQPKVSLKCTSNRIQSHSQSPRCAARERGTGSRGYRVSLLHDKVELKCSAQPRSSFVLELTL